VSGAIVWFTGLPASGKTTLAHRVRAALPPVPGALVLDSDELRAALGERGFADDDRDRFYAIVARLAVMVAHQGLIALVAATAPRRAHRDAARASGAPFVEVWVRTSAEECARRDPKGLYAAARRGDVPALPGVGAAYEPPASPDVIADGGEDERALAAILELVARRADH